MTIKVRWTEQVVAEMRRRWDAGQSASRIGQAFGVSASTICNRAILYGFPARRVVGLGRLGRGDAPPQPDPVAALAARTALLEAAPRPPGPVLPAIRAMLGAAA